MTHIEIFASDRILLYHHDHNVTRKLITILNFYQSFLAAVHVNKNISFLKNHLQKMKEDGDQDSSAFKLTAIIFAVCFGFVLLTLLIEYLLDGGKGNQKLHFCKKQIFVFSTYKQLAKTIFAYYHLKYSGRPGIFFFSSCAKNGCTKKRHGKKIAFYLVAFSESLRTHPT